MLLNKFHKYYLLIIAFAWLIHIFFLNNVVIVAITRIIVSMMFALDAYFQFKKRHIYPSAKYHLIVDILLAIASIYLLFRRLK